MNTILEIYKKLESCDFRVSTDTRADLANSVYFALKGENFDGNKFVRLALKSGAIAAVTEDSKIKGKNIYYVKNTLEALQEVARLYRESFAIPVIAIGGSNGKTTSKELLLDVLKTKYKVHGTVGSLNNHIGVPLSILQMKRDTEIAVFEIGANHPKEHLELLKILRPTHVVVTNNGMDHLEGFLTPKGTRKANKEIFDWALENEAVVFVNKKIKDLVIDCKRNTRILYPTSILKADNRTALTIKLRNKSFNTNLVGRYNLQNIELAVSIGEFFKTNTIQSLKAVASYVPQGRRSQMLRTGNNDFIVDCYNANPTSMKLSIESFLASSKSPRAVVLGDMLELGKLTKIEHLKILKYLKSKKIDIVVLVGKNFKNASSKIKLKHNWFENSSTARDWFLKQKFTNYTFLLKGSRGIKIEKIFDL
jgi:UDP-N-acetylmuramoyl-tripeptide--D-alanyl-D-alanine ligase